MKTLVLAAVMAAIVTPALAADYYIVQEPATKRCRIVEQRPEPNVGVVIGAPFGARVEAENRMRSVEVCREGTTGGPVIREERREERVLPPR
jgi:vancomycin permeability regulator SanA